MRYSYPAAVAGITYAYTKFAVALALAIFLPYIVLPYFLAWVVLMLIIHRQAVARFVKKLIKNWRKTVKYTVIGIFTLMVIVVILA